MLEKDSIKTCLIHTATNTPNTIMYWSTSATKVVIWWNVNVKHGMFGQRKSHVVHKRTCGYRNTIKTILIHSKWKYINRCKSPMYMQQEIMNLAGHDQQCLKTMAPHSHAYFEEWGCSFRSVYTKIAEQFSL